MSAIRGDYRTHKHIPSRSCYQLIIEISEADFPNACQVLGYPATGENTFVGIALLNKEPIEKEPWFAPEPEKKEEGDKLRVRAVLLCKDDSFQEFAYYNITGEHHHKYDETCEEMTINILRNYCNIKSRSELTTSTEAQNKFKELLLRYDQWKLEQTYADNLNRG